MPQTKPPLVLFIIDSSLFIIQRLTDILKDVNTIGKVWTANDYNSAIDVLNKEVTHIVLSDIH